MAAWLTCADTALTSLSAARLGALLREAKPRYARSMTRLVAHRRLIQARYLAARTVAVSLAAAGFAIWLSRLSWDNSTRFGVGAGALLGMAILLELSATLGRRSSDWVMPAFSLLLQPIEVLVAPLSFITLTFAGLLKGPGETNRRVVEAEVELMVEQGERSGLIDEAPAALIRNVLEFSDLTARHAMIPRTRVVAIKVGTPLAAVMQLVSETGHSRYPVYRDEIDDAFGLLYAKDLFQILKQYSSRPPPPPGKAATSPVSSITLLDIVRKPAKFVAESQPLSSLLQEMRVDRQHLAIVVDEFGGFSGVVTLEDVLEEIVGDIQDEFDSEEAPIVHDDQGRLIANAAIPLSELSAYLGSDLDPEGLYESLGGMLTDKLGTIPAVGAAIGIQDIRFVVIESDEKHISRVEIVRRHSVADTSGAHSAIG